ncbi:MAG TPA: antitoxin [Stackebrandtia sp.]|jgi:uncharacterized protein YjbJ (UPF0337 family)|uniref:antitoxin n=1 Tax=Stackebrandtia sp. TaxID=2023065 RepID=UPI002D484809|nr:antitoxin [Stackebrandtia sp.]HZE41756.1 antitoxin [Stackebrandtia sp.]
MGISDKFEELKDKAEGKVEKMKGKTEGKMAETKGQAKGADAGNDNMVDKGADFINEKTGGKYEDKIDTAAEKIKDVTGMGDR